MNCRSVHFIGIGGAGMSGIARILLDRGIRVTGSDLTLSPRTAALAERGATIYRGHRPEHVGTPDCVVVSSAVGPDNPEVVAARRRGLPVWTRGEMLAALVAGSPRAIAVAGTHGKTTTTAMIGFALERAGRDPTVIVGGELAAFGANARSGTGAEMVVETDESDRSFLLLTPAVAVVTNIEADHLDHYRDLDEIVEAFAAFLRKVSPDGLAVLCGDDERVRSLVSAAPCSTCTYGLRRDNRYRATDVELGPFSARFHAWRDDQFLGTVAMPVPGLHNVTNALAAIAVCCELGVPFHRVSAALGDFRGASRRFELIGEVAGIMIIDDYAHHPTEVKAALAAARPLQRRIVAVFQPHRYTRTQKLGSSFPGSFVDADVLVLTDIYAASERPIPGVDAASLARRIEEEEGRSVVICDRETVAREVLRLTRPGDVVITLGAGDIRQVAFDLLRMLQEGSPVAADPVEAK